MFSSNRILALDVGASKIVLAEFTVMPSGAPELLNYGWSALDIEPESGDDPSPYVVAAIRDLMRTHEIRPAPLYMTLSGQTVFPRYVKLPPVSRDKVLQIVRYEAAQNVPFPIDEVVWDYQMIPDQETGDQNVMLVAVKTDNVQRITDCVQAVGLEPQVVDVAPMALYNAVRYNYPDLEGCTMVLDIGARSTNLTFIEQSRIFSRSIPVAGNAITQELMKSFDIGFREAEALKIEHAFVAFGGVYAGPDNEVADRVSKIVRNVVTRLHAEVNRSINFYRSQQNGNAPSLVLLTGGSSVIRYMDTFFREKLTADVEYLNPFAHAPVSERIDTEQIQGELHLLGEVVGLALRRACVCPVEINLMPPDLVARKAFRRRQPYFALAAGAVAMIMVCWWVYAQRMTGVRTRQAETVTADVAGLRSVARKLMEATKGKEQAAARLAQLTDVASLRSQWLKLLAAAHACMLEGMWITEVTPKVAKGKIHEVEIAGKGFQDRLDAVEKDDSTDRTAVEVFRDRLREMECFTEKTEITHESARQDTDARDFKVLLRLTKPIRL